MTKRIDHIVIGADDLESGGAALEALLGVGLTSGSKHDTMSTHNRVMQVGGSAFFELISVDPDAPDPGRSRWFSLDDPATQARFAGGPTPLTWVVSTPDLDDFVKTSPVDLGEIVDFRRGERTWHLTVPRGGDLVMGGAVPHFIEWSPGPHPSLGQQDLGIRLQGVVARSDDPSRLADVFEQLGIRHLAAVEQGPPGVSFDLTTASGEVRLA